MNELLVGDILVFKGHGVVFQLLSRFLKLFERDYDRWGWHMAYVSHIDKDVFIAESLGSGVQINLLTDREYQAYHWLDKVDENKLTAFTADHLDCNYDVAVYFWTMLQYLVLHFFNHSIPRLLDNRYTCWEFVFLMCREMGKPVQALHTYPMLTDFLKGIK